MGAKPYVGITGLVTEDEVASVLDEFTKAGYSASSSHAPMLGFLVSQKTLNGIPTKNRRYPKLSDIHSLLEKIESKVLPMIHYNSRDTGTLAYQLTKIFDGIYQEGLCRSIQLNILYPDMKQILLAKKSLPELKIVFQASSSIMEGKTPREISRSITPYGQIIDYILIDPSGGRGKNFDIKKSINVYEELSHSAPNVKIGFAGGLNGENVYNIVREIRLRTGTSGFCIDSEGGLRDKLSEEYGDDTLNTDKVKSYVKNSASALGCMPD